MVERYPDKIEAGGSIPPMPTYIIIMEEEKNKSEYSEYIAYLCDRIQKVTNAAYRVTDLLSDKEPLKWAMREKAVSIFSNLISSSNKTFLEKNNSLEEAEQLINQLIILFSLFEDEKSVSGMNFKILKQEYASISETIAKERNSRDFFKIFWGEEQKTPKLSNGHAIGQDSKEMSNKKSNGQPVEAKEAKQEVKNKKSTNKNISTTERRKEQIFQIIKDKGQITVGELSSVFAEYSEKTIQRDLLEMVSKGILTKQGDKRWRTYILKASF